MATYADLARRLGDSGLQLLGRMVELHLDRRPGSRAEFIWIKSDSMASDFTALSFTGSSGSRSVDLEHDPVDFQEMIDTGIVKRGHGRNAYRLTHTGQELHRIVVEARGPAPIAQLDTAVRTMLDDPARLARSHPAVAQHLQTAFDLLWSETLSDQIVINIGNELRSALTQMAVDLVGYSGDDSPERVVEALTPWLDEDGRLPPRSPELLRELLRWAAKATQRIHHLHDERAKPNPDPERAEIRRTAFTVAFLLYELDAVAP
jgi:hypothetical protein